MRSSAFRVTLLPEPDSPSRPSTSPSSSPKSTPLSACTVRSPVKRTRRFLIVDDRAHGPARHLSMMIGDRLPGVAQRDQFFIAERSSNQLDTDRQTRLRPAGRNHQARQPEIVHRAHEARDPLDRGLGAGAAAHIGLLDGRRRRSRRRRHHHVDVADGGEMRGERRPAPAQRLQILDAAIGEAVLQPGTHLGAVVLGAGAQPRRMQAGRLGAEHDQRRRADRGLVRQVDRDGPHPELAQAVHHRVERLGDIRLEILDVEL